MISHDLFNCRILQQDVNANYGEGKNSWCWNPIILLS